MNTDVPKENRNESANEKTDMPAAGNLIVATQVPEHRRLSFLPRYLGKHMLLGEVLVYSSLESLCDDYNGGYWEYYDLSNGGFYMAPAIEGKLRLIGKGNFFEGDVSADAAGIIATLMALNQLCWDSRSDRHIRLFYLLRGFALEHAESGLILGAID